MSYRFERDGMSIRFEVEGPTAPGAAVATYFAEAGEPERRVPASELATRSFKHAALLRGAWLSAVASGWPMKVLQ